MDKLLHNNQENTVTLKRNDYMNFEIMTNGRKKSFRFEKVPNFYIIDHKEYYAVCSFFSLRLIAQLKIEKLY